MKKSEFFVGAAACCVAMLLVSGCRQGGISEIDRADRASRLYSAAMAELQAGRIDSAIKGFQSVNDILCFSGYLLNSTCLTLQPYYTSLFYGFQ